MGVVKHTKTSTVPDGDDATLVQPSDWNDDHDVTLTVADIDGAASDADLAQHIADGAHDLLDIAGAADFGGVVTFGGDTNLYRLGANTLATDDAFVVGHAAGMFFGTGLDTNLYRQAAGFLRTDGQRFTIGSPASNDTSLNLKATAGHVEGTWTIRIPDGGATAPFTIAEVAVAEWFRIERTTGRVTINGDRLAFGASGSYIDGNTAVGAGTNDIYIHSDDYSFFHGNFRTIIGGTPSGGVSGGITFAAPIVSEGPSQPIIVSGGSDRRPLAVKGTSGQTADLFQALDSTDAELVSIEADGKLVFGTNGRIYGAYESGSRNLHVHGYDRLKLDGYAVNFGGIGWEGTAGQTLQENGYVGGFDFFGTWGAKFRFGDTSITPGALASFKQRGAGTANDTIIAWFESLVGDTYPTVVVKAGSAQDEDLQQWRASNDTVLAAIEDDGKLRLGSRTLYDGGANQLWLDGAASLVVSGNSFVGATLYFGLGGDTDLYRSGADALKTDDSFVAALGVGPNAGALWTYDGNAPDRISNPAYIRVPVITGYGGNGTGSLGVSGGQNYWSNVFLSGGLYFGQGGVAEDVNLYRSAADTLKTDDTLKVVKRLVVGADDSAGGMLDGDLSVQRSSGQGAIFFGSPTRYLFNDGTDWQLAGGTNVYLTAGLVFNNDTTLYRSAANVLATDDHFFIVGDHVLGFYGRSATSVSLYESTVTGDAHTRFSVTADGTIYWGSGSAVVDTNLYRGAAGYVTTDGSFWTKGSYIAFGSAGDTNLYRASANELRTDDRFTVGGDGAGLDSDLTVFGATGGSRLTYNVAANEGADNLGIRNGKIVFGAPYDTNLYRSAADTLKTDDNFVVGGGYITLNDTIIARTDPGEVGWYTTSARFAALRTYNDGVHLGEYGSASARGYVDIDGDSVASDASAPSAGIARLFARDDGSGNDELAVRFASGSAQVLAVEGADSPFWTQVVNEDGTSFANFTATDGTWSSASSVIKQTDTTGGTFLDAYYTAKVATALMVYEAEIQLRNSGVNCIGGLVLGYDGSTLNGLSVRIDEGSNEVLIDAESGTAHLSISTAIAVNTWYKVRIVGGNNSASVYLDGTLIGSVRFIPGTALRDASRIGLYTYQSEVWFRNIKAWTPRLPA